MRSNVMASAEINQNHANFNEENKFDTNSPKNIYNDYDNQTNSEVKIESYIELNLSDRSSNLLK
jgi:hypothetical protein